jgi:hypothetical protein
MDRVRLDELMRTWLEMLSRTEDVRVAARAASALDLHAVLTSGRPVPDRLALATQYARLIETLMSPAARPTRISRRQRAAEDVAADPLATRLDRFWSEGLENLKRELEAERPAPAGKPSPPKRS